MWQDEVFKDLKSRLTERVGVEEVIPLGSLAEGDVDKWSDLDVGLVVSLDEHTRYFPTLAWLEELGEIYAYNQSQSPEKSTTRVIFANGRRNQCVNHLLSVGVERKENHIDKAPAFWLGSFSL